MLKTTMLVAGLAAGSAALTPKGCDGTFTGTKPEALSTVDCTNALINDAACVETRPAAADQTAFGGKVYCSAHLDPVGVADTDDCFEYKVNAGGCGLITDAQWTAYGCTNTSPTPNSLGGDAQNPLLSCTPDVANGYASFTSTDSDGVRGGWGSAAVNMKCGSDGNWEFETGKGVSKDGMCAHTGTGGAYTNTANTDNYRFATSTTKTPAAGLLGDYGCTDGTPGNCLGFASLTTWTIFADSVGGMACAGTAGQVTNVNVFVGQSCAVEHKRGASKAFFGALTCEEGSGKGKFTALEGMCKYPKRSETNDLYLTGTVPADWQVTTDPTGKALGAIICGSPANHALGTNLITYGIPASNAGDTAALNGGWMPKTSANMVCVSSDATGGKSALYTCDGSHKTLASGDIATAETICSADENPAVYIGGTAVSNAAAGTGVWTAGTMYTKPYLGLSYTLASTQLGTYAPNGSTDTADRYFNKFERLKCTCDGPTGKYKCSTVAGCLATSANKEIATQAGYPIKSTGVVAQSFHGSTAIFSATGYQEGRAICDEGTWKYSSGGGKDCAAKATPTAAADIAAVEQELGFVYSGCGTVANSYCGNKAADATKGRTTCTKYTNWNAGFVMCDGATGTWKNQSDYSRCLSATDAESEAMNYASATFATVSSTNKYPARPGSTAAVTCKDGLTGEEVVDANGEMVNIQQGSGKCNTDGSGSVEWTPCLMSCNSTLVEEDLNSTSVGIDIAQTDCSGLKVWNNQTERTWEFDCATQAADTYTGGRVYCNGITGKHEADDAEEKMCDAPAPGIVGALCATLYSTSENADKAAVNSAEKACETLGLWGAADTIDETSEAYLVKYDCGTGVKNDDACTFEANTTGYDVSSTCCTTTACQANADCYQMTADTEKGCWNFEVVDNSASIMGAGVVTLLALFHL